MSQTRTIEQFILATTKDSGRKITKDLTKLTRKMISASVNKDDEKMEKAKKDINEYIIKLSCVASAYGCEFETTILYFKDYSNEIFIQALSSR